VLAIGIFGTIANGLLLYALIAHHAHDVKKRAINLPIINQNILDLSCCLLLVISVCVQINSTYLTGALGYFLCTFFMNETATNSALNGSIINLVALTLERYLKVVHPFWSKKHLKRWMAYAAMVFAWIGGILSAAPDSFIAARLEDGFCIAYLESPEANMISASCHFLLFFLCPLLIFIYCYARIIVVIRRQSGRGTTWRVQLR